MAVSALIPRRNTPLFFRAYMFDNPSRVSPHYPQDSLAVVEPDVVPVELLCKPLAVHYPHVPVKTDFLVTFTTDELKRMVRISKIDSSSVAINWDDITDKIQPKFSCKV